jgi:hypothetical protein
MINVEVNRDTGRITLTNPTGANVDFTSLAIGSAFEGINPTALTPVTGTYDINGTTDIDDNDAWVTTSANGSHTVYREQTTGDFGTLEPSEQVFLSIPGGWARSPNEDLVVSVLLESGIVINADVTYTGNGDQAFSRSDLDFDNDLDGDDWAQFLAYHDMGFPSLSLPEAYAFGDLNGDRKNDFLDFRVFQFDYIQAHGQAAFDALLNQIPEPSSLLLAIVAAPCCGLFRRSRRKRAC